MTIDLAATSASLQRIRDTIAQRVLGQDEVIDQLLAAYNFDLHRFGQNDVCHFFSLLSE